MDTLSGPALLLPGGCVMVMPTAAGVVLRSLEKIAELQRRDGLPASSAFQALVAVFAEATAEVRSSEAGRSEVPQQRLVTASVASDRGSVLVDPVSAEQAAELLGCSSRNVRGLCSREVFETAQRTRAGWEIERAEVQGRARQRSPSVVLGSRGRAYWAGVDAQARR
jgi:hypothetical protein